MGIQFGEIAGEHAEDAAGDGGHFGRRDIFALVALALLGLDHDAREGRELGDRHIEIGRRGLLPAVAKDCSSALLKLGPLRVVPLFVGEQGIEHLARRVDVGATRARGVGGNVDQLLDFAQRVDEILFRRAPQLREILKLEHVARLHALERCLEIGAPGKVRLAHPHISVAR